MSAGYAQPHPSLEVSRLETRERTEGEGRANLSRVPKNALPQYQPFPNGIASMALMLSLAQQCLNGADQELHCKDTMGRKGFDSESWKYRSMG